MEKPKEHVLKNIQKFRGYKVPITWLDVANKRSQIAQLKETFLQPLSVIAKVFWNKFLRIKLFLFNIYKIISPRDALNIVSLTIIKNGSSVYSVIAPISIIVKPAIKGKRANLFWIML